MHRLDGALGRVEGMKAGACGYLHDVQPLLIAAHKHARRGRQRQRRGQGHGFLCQAPCPGSAVGVAGVFHLRHVVVIYFKAQFAILIFRHHLKRIYKKKTIKNKKREEREIEREHQNGELLPRKKEKEIASLLVLSSNPFQIHKKHIICLGNLSVCVHTAPMYLP